jgi:hypothetical protein
MNELRPSKDRRRARGAGASVRNGLRSPLGSSSRPDVLHKPGPRHLCKSSSPIEHQPSSRRGASPTSSAGAPITTRYIDAATFTALFRNRKRNRAKICEGFRLLVDRIAGQFWFLTIQDREDMEAHALLKAIERIDRFKFARGKNAFAYYSSLIWNASLRDYRRHRRRQATPLMPLNFSDVEEVSTHEKNDESETFELAIPYAMAV